jgi:hypothetical protein
VSTNNPGPLVKRWELKIQYRKHPDICKVAGCCPYMAMFPGITKQNIFLKKSSENGGFCKAVILLFLRLKIEQYPYMIRTPIIHVKILRNFIDFFNGGFP